MLSLELGLSVGYIILYGAQWMMVRVQADVSKIDCRYQLLQVMGVMGHPSPLSPVTCFSHPFILSDPGGHLRPH